MLISAFTGGCQSTQNKAITRLMKVLPENTDTLFILEADGIAPVPDLVHVWDSITEEILPSGATPLRMGMATQQGNLLSVLYLFTPGETPGTFEVEVETTEYRGREITTTDGVLNTFYLDDIRMISPVDYTQGIIDSYQDEFISMHNNPEYKNILGRSYSGIFVIIKKGLVFGGMESVVGLDFSFKDGVDGTMVISGIFDFKSADNAASVADSLDSFFTGQVGFSNFVSRQKGSTIEISGEIGTVNFTDFMNSLTTTM